VAPPPADTDWTGHGRPTPTMLTMSTMSAETRDELIFEKDFCYAVDARKSEVPQDAPRQPRGAGVCRSTVAFGEYGLMSLERCWLDTKQIEAARVAIARNNEAAWKNVDTHFPAKVVHEEAAGNAHWARARAAGNRGWRSSARQTCCLKWTA